MMWHFLKWHRIKFTFVQDPTLWKMKQNEIFIKIMRNFEDVMFEQMLDIQHCQLFVHW